MKRLFISLLILFIIAVPAWRYQKEHSRDILFQTSTLNALLEGLYDGPVTLHELSRRGDFGIGTFNALDGEMVELNGRFYQMRADSTVRRMKGSDRTPFAMVTRFEADKRVFIDQPIDYPQLQQRLDRILPSRNVFCAIKIEGMFSYVKVRSVPRQTLPYPRLAAVVKTQPTFELNGVKGTLAGFYVPEYAQGINIPGYHFHFITQDRKAGGHLLDCRVQQATIELDDTPELSLSLPRTDGFYRIDLPAESGSEAKSVER